MVIGVPNPNMLVPLQRMHITKLDAVTKLPLKGDIGFDVLYNPDKYEQSKGVQYSNMAGLSMEMPVTQFAHGMAETLTFTLFFDSMSAGAEVGGSVGDKAKFAANSVLPSMAKVVDVRTYTEKVYSLMSIDESIHVPPLLKLNWGSLVFVGHLVSCKQTFTRFSERGIPLRAWVECTFRQFISNIGTVSLQSPDVTKTRTIHEGDSLWALAADEYNDAGMWRQIAASNQIVNPRKLRSGTSVVLPAIVKK